MKKILLFTSVLTCGYLFGGEAPITDRIDSNQLEKAKLVLTRLALAKVLSNQQDPKGHHHTSIGVGPFDSHATNFSFHFNKLKIIYVRSNNNNNEQEAVQTVNIDLKSKL